MFHLRVITLAVICSVYSLKAGNIQFHHGIGIGGAWQSSLGGIAKYNARLNLFNNDNWSLSISGVPHVGGEINRPDQDAFRPFFIFPMTADFNWGMGSSFDCLRYKGYSLKIGLSPASFATNQKDIFSSDIKSVPAYIGVDLKRQTERLKTYALEVGLFITQKNTSYLNEFGAVISFNYLFGTY